MAAAVSDFRGGGLGIGTVIVLGLIGWALGIDPSMLIGGAELINGGSQYQQDTGRQPAHRRAERRDRPVRRRGARQYRGHLDRDFPEPGQQYRPPRLRLYRGGEQGGCGFAQAAMGPFYCPTDQRIYLDTSFFNDMQVRFHGCSGKACEFAEAYVIAHEVGHHVQNLLGTLPKAQRRAARRRQQSGGQPHPGAGRVAGRLLRRHLGASFRPALELRSSRRHRSGAADRRRHRRRPAAAAVARPVVPDSFTHGTSAQRQRWFTNGLKAGTAVGLRHFRGGFTVRTFRMPGID